MHQLLRPAPRSILSVETNSHCDIVEPLCKVVDLFKHVDRGSRSMRNLIEDCYQLCNRRWNCSITFLCRQHNKAANFLAKMAHTINANLILLQEPPEVIKMIFETKECIPLTVDRTGVIS